MKTITTIIVVLLSFGMSFSQSKTAAYQYDDLNRLTRIIYNNCSEIVYTYDETGNRTAQTITSQPIPTLLQDTVIACNGSTATINASIASGTVQWFATATSQTVLSTGNSFTTSALLNDTLFYVAGHNGSCTTNKIPVYVKVNAVPATPTANTSIAYCQNATATQLTATGNNLLWYSVATGGTGTATAPTPLTTSAGTTDYYVSQTANSCVSQRTQITVTVNSIPALPTVTSTVTYCQNTTASQLTATGSNLLWFTSATGGTGSTTTPMPSTANAGTTNYYVSQTVNTCESPRANITVNVNATPANPTVTSSVSYCQSETASQLTATGTSLLWYTAPTGGTGNTTAPTPSTTNAGTTNYYVSQTANSCESQRATISVIVIAKPANPSVNSSVSYCQDATANPLTATGSNLLWYTVSTGGTGTATAPTPSTTTAGTTNYYVSQTVNSCESNRAQISVLIKATPLIPTVTSPVEYCQYSTANQLTATGNSLLWFTTPTGGTGTSIAPTPSTNNTGTVNYYVSQTVTGCTSPRAQIDVVINVTPNAPTVTTSITYCQNVTASQLTATGSNLLWYNSATGGTGITIAFTPSTVNAGTMNYYVSQTAGNCESNRTLITVTVNSIPASPTVTSTVAYCQNVTASQLTATGSNLLWFTSVTGGTGNATAPTPSTTSAGTINYYVSQTVNTCESPRANITVNVNATPANPTVTSSVTYCQSETASQLTATGTSLLWYNTATGGTGNTVAPTPSTTNSGTTNYYVSQTANSCESPRATISVIVIAKPANPYVNSSISYCQDATANPLTATGSNLLWYTTSTGGTGNVIAPSPSTATTGTTNYFVSQTVNSCESNRAQISVIVNATPQTPVITQNQNTLTSSSATGNQWYDASGLIIGETNQTYTATADGNYYVIVTTNGCSSSQSNAINVTIIGITEMSLNSTINIYPNPVKDELTIEITNSITKLDFEILNIIGEVIYTSTIEKKTTISTTHFPSGEYLIKLYSNKSTVIKKFVKQ